LKDDSAEVDWTVALAGGEGVRLSSYIERRFGRRITKQYCCLLGNRSMLEHTLERLKQDHTGVAHADRDRDATTAIGRIASSPARATTCSASRRRRDTGLALYIALAMIKRWTPNAIVTITPTDRPLRPRRRRSTSSRSARRAVSRSGSATG